jgi:hypothetical protein
MSIYRDYQREPSRQRQFSYGRSDIINSVRKSPAIPLGSTFAQELGLTGQASTL